MPFSVKVASNIDDWMRKWRKRSDKLAKTTEAAPRTVAEWAAKEAKLRAPIDTSNLVQAIGYTQGGNKDQWIVLVRPGFKNPKGGRLAGAYAKVMHKTPISLAEGIWGKHGKDPHFMFTVRDLARKRLKRNLQIAAGEFLGKPPRNI